ncbi:2-hydroxyacid dehydrogenase [Phytohalomonas tamaricis]|uniref:2-hydroxyacid dehydrogenase n=1 Tax=Phytohalomonas tamaricis TaxID=2081032 RepID=UPI000D0B2DA8|nr:2-hydroxyacid dehydrogenase [Phytohalomonas tamaricis]
MTKVAFFSAQPYDQRFFDAANRTTFKSHGFELIYHPVALSAQTVPLAEGCDAVCIFVNDMLDADTIEALHGLGVRGVLLRCAGFNNVDLEAAKQFGLFIARVPAYSPEAVAEHAVALMMTLNRRIHRAYNRVREGNFALDGLLGMTMHGKTVGVVGTGKIGLATARILHGFGCRMLGFDPMTSAEFKEIGEYVDLEVLLEQSDIVTLHCPLIPATEHIIDVKALGQMKPGAMLINTSRGGLVDTRAVISALKLRHLGALAIDVYEQENGIFFLDHSSEIIDDDIFQRLMTFPNVLVTGHQGFFTAEALSEIAEVTLENLICFAAGSSCNNALVVTAPDREVNA